MAMIKCKECGKDISDKSKECVNCGAPVKIKNNGETWLKRHKKKLFVITITIVLFIIVKTFCFSAFRMSGSSMSPTLKDGDIRILNKMDKSFKRYDVIVVNYNNSLIPRRVYGLPGETIEVMSDGSVYVNGKVIEDNYSYLDESEQGQNVAFVYTKKVLDKNEYFVLGDNRKTSIDSCLKKNRFGVGPIMSIKKEDIKGTLLGIR